MQTLFSVEGTLLLYLFFLLSLLEQTLLASAVKMHLVSLATLEAIVVVTVILFYYFILEPVVPSFFLFLSYFPSNVDLN